MAKYYLAIDIGASSGRHILGSVQDGRIVLEEVFRFENRQLTRNGHVCWDTDNLWEGILGGLKACGELGKIPETIGIDTWGVDYVLLDENDQPVGDAVAYRDSRTEGMDKVVDHVLVFKGNGEIKDFPGNYTQYREWQKLQESEQKQNNQIKDKSKQEAYKNDNQSLRKRKMSFKEKKEFESLEKDIEQLESEKKTIEKALSGTVLNPDKIKELSKRLYDVNYELELKSERWFELAEIID